MLSAASLASPSTKNAPLSPKECVEVSGRLFMGSDTAARVRETMKRCGITHILNLSAFTSDEYCAPPAAPPVLQLTSFPAVRDDVSTAPGDTPLCYRSIFLQDSPKADIMCILFDSLDWIRAAHAAGGTVFVHCAFASAGVARHTASPRRRIAGCAGLSRSTAVVMSFLIWRDGLSYDGALALVRTVRPQAEPNVGFAMAISEWAARRASGAWPPQLFRVQPHSESDPKRLVLRTVAASMSLDSRCAFVLRTADALYVVRGAQCHDAFAGAAMRHAELLMTFENLTSAQLMVVSGSAVPPPAFLALLQSCNVANLTPFDPAGIDEETRMFVSGVRGGAALLAGVGASELFSSPEGAASLARLPDAIKAQLLIRNIASGRSVVALLEAGASADTAATGQGGGTVLHLAARCRAVESLRALVDAGADHSIVDSSGKTALFYAALLGDTVRLLRRSGAGRALTLRVPASRSCPFAC